MKTRYTLATIVGIAAVGATLAFAQTPPKDSKGGAHPPAAAGQEMQLPPGWTPEDAAACAAAMTPGPEHERLLKSVGVWQGKNKMWMAPGAEPMASESTTTIKPMMDGRFTSCEVSGEMPGMGPFHGFGIYGFDNVTQKFQSTWIDNCGTAVACGSGDLSSDGDTMTWVYNYTCPITRKPVTMREVERTLGPDSKTLEIYGIDPKSGKEYKMMEAQLTRKPGSAAGAHN